MKRPGLAVSLLLAVSFGAASLVWAATDVITVTTVYETYALGEPVAVTVRYSGTTHGDVKLKALNSQGGSYGDWSWSHLGGETYEQVATIRPTQAGRLILEAVHVPHHGEPSVRASRAISVWSARIVGLDLPDQANATAQIAAKISVLYLLTQPTNVEVGVWERATGTQLGEAVDSLSGEGSKTYEIQLSTPAGEQTWTLEARVYYEVPGRGMLHDEAGWSATTNLQVIPEFKSVTGTVFIMALLTVMLSLSVLQDQKMR